MGAFDPYAAVLTVASASLLLIAGGVGTKQLVRQRCTPLRVRARRRRP
jgi:hypothetical protein